MEQYCVEFFFDNRSRFIKQREAYEATVRACRERFSRELSLAKARYLVNKFRKYGTVADRRKGNSGRVRSSTNQIVEARVSQTVEANIQTQRRSWHKA